MNSSTLTMALLAGLGLLAASCDTYSTSGNPHRDDDLDDDSADDDTAGDDDWDGPSPDDVQEALDAISSWPTIDGCEDVVIYATNAGAAVELNFSASVELAQIDVGAAEDEQFDLSVPGSGAVLSVKAGSNLGTTQCTGNPGDPEVTDNYSVESGTVTLTVNRLGPAEYAASIQLSGVELLRVGGEETVHIPNVTLSQISVGD